nr:uncharacterized protein LOC107415020 isoform X2 [Ziziphus jujuba var. spinosa]
MVSDQEIAKGVESLLRQSDPNSVTTLNGVVQQLEAKLGLDLSHKAVFIRDQINLLLRSHPQTQTQLPPPKDHFALHSHPQFPTASHSQQFPAHFALHPHHRPVDAQTFQQQPPAPPPPQPQLLSAPVQPQLQPPAKPNVFPHNAVTVASEAPKESPTVGAKRRGGPGGLNKVCGVSPELQAIVGEPALPRTEIVKQLWAYIRKNNLQDPSNKRKIICDDALRLVFETDCTDMFKMNKLLSKHIIALDPINKSSQAKRVKVDVEPSTESAEIGSSSPVIISEALAKFLGTGGREMLPSEALRRVWEYIKVNRLEDLLGCKSISALGIQEMLTRHHLFKQS